jgi:ribosome-binding factor A
MKERIPRINQLFKKEVGKIILEDIDFPENVLVTITEVDTSPNLIQSKIYISCLPEEKIDNVFKILSKQIYEIQKKLDKKLRMRPVPKIIFKKEKKTSEADRIEGILEKIKSEEK